MTLLQRLETGLQRLADRSPDGTRERNDSGFNANDLAMGESLAASAGNWSGKLPDAFFPFSVANVNNAPPRAP